jgi:hypothetical protein
MPLTRKIAYIDLSSGNIKTGSIPEKIRRLYLGGRGIDMYLLYNHVKPGCDPMGPENVVTVSAGLLGGSMAPAAARCHSGAKSPLTHGVGSCNMGGFFAPELTFAGFHHLLRVRRINLSISGFAMVSLNFATRSISGAKMPLKLKSSSERNWGMKRSRWPV